MCAFSAAATIAIPQDRSKRRVHVYTSNVEDAQGQDETTMCSTEPQVRETFSDGFEHRCAPVWRLRRRIGLYRVACYRVALRDSKYHKRGDVYKVDCEMDADVFYETVAEELLPNIREKMVDFDVFYVQIDRARPRVRRWNDL